MRKTQTAVAVSGAPQANVRLDKKNTKARNYLQRNFWLYVFAVPALTWLLIFCYAPMSGILVAFKRYTGAYSFWESKWVGMRWFNSFFKSYYFEQVITNTLRLSLYNLATFPLPIILALMLNELRHEGIKRTVQTILYTPHFISTVVICSMISLFFAQETGFVTKIIGSITGEAPKWLTSADAFPHLYVWSGVWQQLGWNCVIYVAALSSIDPTQHEAAAIDGANRLQRIWHINLPSIAPTIIITLILRVGQIMSLGTDKVLLLKNGLNQDTALTIGLLVYERGMVSGDFGYATAVGLFTNVINLILVLSVNWISRKVSNTSLF
jgi:putative aldouronate transport system permease protein